MKVFISWSGERSKHMAVALKEWLPMTLQHVEPWMSDEDVQAGERWATSVATELQTCNVGIVCVTNENLSSEWLHFEAGALSKSLHDGVVITALLDVDVQAVTGPLTQFQMKKVDEAGILDIAHAINKHSGGKLDDKNLSNVVGGLWGALNDKLQEIPSANTKTTTSRTQNEVLEDVVTSVRGLRRQIDDIYESRDSSSHPMRSRGSGTFHPMKLFDEMFEISEVGGSRRDPLALLVLAGFARRDVPLMSEILVEFYRRFKIAKDEDEWMELDFHLRRVCDGLIRTSMFINGFSSKRGHLFILNFQKVLDMTLDKLRYAETRDEIKHSEEQNDDNVDDVSWDTLHPFPPKNS